MASPKLAAHIEGESMEHTMVPGGGSAASRFTRRGLLPGWKTSFIVLAGAFAVVAQVQAQANPEIANCAELKEEAVAAQAALCTAHVGCSYILHAQQSCARAKGYLERLQAAIGEGTKTFFGTYRKEVTPDAVFTAALGGEDYEQARKLGGLAQFQQQAQDIAARVREVSSGYGHTKSGRNSRNDWIYYGQLSGDSPEGDGTWIFSDGEIQRGHFTAGEFNGVGEVLYAKGHRFIGNYIQGDADREGVFVFKSGQIDVGTDWSNGTFSGERTKVDGTRFKGRIDSKNNWLEGKAYRADGSLAEEGTYESGKLSVGAIYDAAGARTEVNLPAERQAVARAAAEKARLDAEAEQQLKRQQAAQAEQQFRASLQTLNAGQLFARADELNAQGDRVRAREVQRALLNRFPDHPLAVTAARQMGGDTTGNSSGNAQAGNRLPSGVPARACEAMKQMVMSAKVPPNASITSSMETVMYMTKVVLDMIANGCPTEAGTTPAQIEAEKRERERQYAEAEKACNAVQVGGRRCVPQAHSADVAVSKPAAPPPPPAPAAKPVVSFDPATGRCYPPDAEECRRIPNTRGYSPNSSSDGRIRTAR
ncbi:hypothetical protein [Variovorax ginsengisoli]|uniref:MORN repeat-containing protein n=1 Tax=Variovorax ginsengisoli TaxID=363844 RepID=A0ABT9SF15_9BURK|nr:hypothetical protein [Variovorax ginsengisoli]MDP9902955.1 hypothetical protein [Variovorax ginsengisoli]